MAVIVMSQSVIKSMHQDVSYPEQRKENPCQIIVVDAGFCVDCMLGLDDFLVTVCVMLEFLANL